jgi:hypothetical protein
MWIPNVLKNSRHDAKPSAEPGGSAEAPGVLVVTLDDRLYYSIFPVAADLGWTIRRARSFEDAWKELHSGRLPLVIYDEHLPGTDWEGDLRSFSTFPARPLVVLAVPEVNEDLWRAVLRCHGYDAVKRTARESEWLRTLRFAWLSRQLSWTPDDRNEPNAKDYASASI